MSLDKIRVKINKIDKKVIPLLKKRMDLSVEVAKIKKEENLPIYHPERESQILKKVEADGGEYGSFIKSVYHSLMAESRRLQNDFLAENVSSSDFDYPKEIKFTRAVCQGTEGSFSHAAARKMFPELPISFKTTFEEVFNEIEKDETAVGILPAENSNAGSVSTVYDLLLTRDLKIVRKIGVGIEQNLLSIGELSDVKTVYSHPHALKQCKKFLKEYGIKAMEYENTALAASYVASLNDKSIGAIGSAEAAELYGLKISAPSIQDENDNMTRFIAVSKKAYITPNSNTVSIAVSIPNEKGSLYAILGRFMDCGLNLSKIESRPVGHDFEYRFYIDFDGNISDKGVLKLLTELKKELAYFVFLGNYVDEF